MACSSSRQARQGSSGRHNGRIGPSVGGFKKAIEKIQTVPYISAVYVQSTDQDDQ